jgi:hypothetical protein
LILTVREPVTRANSDALPIMHAMHTPEEMPEQEHR